MCGPVLPAKVFSGDMAKAVGFADLYFRIFDYGEQHMCPDRGKAVLIAGYWSGICSMAAAIF